MKKLWRNPVILCHNLCHFRRSLTEKPAPAEEIPTSVHLSLSGHPRATLLHSRQNFPKAFSSALGTWPSAATHTSSPQASHQPQRQAPGLVAHITPSPLPLTLPGRRSGSPTLAPSHSVPFSRVCSSKPLSQEIWGPRR